MGTPRVKAAEEEAERLRGEVAVMRAKLEAAEDEVKELRGQAVVGGHVDDNGLEGSVGPWAS